MRQAIITVDLGFGDSGKGAWVDFLTREYKANLVIRYSGGSQCGHNVQLPNGRRHTFSQFGAGTFAGAYTYLGLQVIVNPYALAKEAKALYDAGVNDIARRLHFHPKCLITTVFHQFMNRLKEVARSSDPNSIDRHGSCGHGIGETRSYWLKHGDDAIFAEDLDKPRVMHAKLELLRQRMLLGLEPIADSLPRTAQEKYNLYALNPLNEMAVLNRLAKSHMTMSMHVPGFEDSERPVIFEGAQGILLDEYYGFHPHTTWSTVGPHHALEMVYDMGFDECCVLGITRTYTTRHGAGPLPTYDEELTRNLTDPGNPFNEWQGNMRCGHLDLPLLRYAVDCCGGLDGVLLSHMDKINGDWKVCTEYHKGGSFFQPQAQVLPSLTKQQVLGEYLQKVKPVLESVTPERLQRLLIDRIGPLYGAANGPTHQDRQIFDLKFRKRA